MVLGTRTCRWGHTDGDAACGLANPLNRNNHAECIFQDKSSPDTCGELPASFLHSYDWKPPLRGRGEGLGLGRSPAV